MKTPYYPDSNKRRIAVIGGGPAGLKAAEVAAEKGAAVCLFEAKRSLGRKFLVAGKSGLNLTNRAQAGTFVQQYSGDALPTAEWGRKLEAFNQKTVCDWAASLGIDTFETSGGKVFPVGKKAAPILNRWLQKIKALGVSSYVNYRWIDFQRSEDGYLLEFNHLGEIRFIQVDAIIFALGGASWSHTGSDGHWSECFKKRGIQLRPFAAANCGWQCDWTAETLKIAEGQPLHHLSVQAGDRVERGELMVTRYGLEGTPVYRLGPTLRSMQQARITIDFKPVFSEAHCLRKMESVRKGWFQEAQTRWKLSPAMCAIIQQFHPEVHKVDQLVQAAKHCTIPLRGPQPIQEAISTAGGVAWAALKQNYQLDAYAHIYVAGEMIDWEAPSGGYLIHACLMTGAVAGASAAS